MKLKTLILIITLSVYTIVSVAYLWFATKYSTISIKCDRNQNTCEIGNKNIFGHEFISTYDQDSIVQAQQSIVMLSKGSNSGRTPRLPILEYSLLLTRKTENKSQDIKIYSNESRALGSKNPDITIINTAASELNSYLKSKDKSFFFVYEKEDNFFISRQGFDTLLTGFLIVLLFLVF